MDYDDVLAIIGPFGKYQKLVIFLVLQLALFPCGLLLYNAVFYAATPSDYWCKLPIENTSENFVKSLLPMEERDGHMLHSRCRMYDLNYSSVNMGKPTFSSNHSFTATIPCRYGWTFDQSVYENTVVTEFELICEWDLGQALSMGLVTFGGLFGPLIFGVLADQWGRKKAYFFMIAFQSVFSVSTAFSGNFFWYCVCRFMVGSTLSFSYTLPFLLSIELTGPKTRVLISTVCSFGYTLSVIIVVGIAYLVRTWRTLCISTTFPLLGLLLLWPFYPESPRWLLAKGRYQELETFLRRMARINGTQLSKDFDEALPKIIRQIDTQDHTKKTSFIDLFRTPNLRKKTLILALVNFCNVGVFVGLNYYAPAFGENPHLNALLSTLTELLPYAFATFACNQYGRRVCLVGGLILAAASSIAAVGVPTTVPVAIMGLTLATKFFVTLTFLIGELMEEETFPTVVRAEGHSLTSLLSSVAGTCAPFIVHLGHSLLVLPLGIFGGLCLITGFVSLFLPETAGTDLPQTLQDGESAGRDMPWREVFAFRIPVLESKANLTVMSTTTNSTDSADEELVQNNHSLQLHEREKEATGLLA